MNYATLTNITRSTRQRNETVQVYRHRLTAEQLQN